MAIVNLSPFWDSKTCDWSVCSQRIQPVRTCILVILSSFNLVARLPLWLYSETSLGTFVHPPPPPDQLILIISNTLLDPPMSMTRNEWACEWMCVLLQTKSSMTICLYSHRSSCSNCYCCSGACCLGDDWSWILEWTTSSAHTNPSGLPFIRPTTAAWQLPLLWRHGLN